MRCDGTSQPWGRNDPEGRRNGDEGKIQSLTMGVRTSHAARLTLVAIHVKVEEIYSRQNAKLVSRGRSDVRHHGTQAP